MKYYINIFLSFFIALSTIGVHASTVDTGINNQDFIEVQLDQDRQLLVAKTEVTVAQWNKCVTAGVCPDMTESNTNLDHPVVNISWIDVQIYLKWLNRQSSQVFRVPSEAEWLAFAMEHAPRPIKKIFDDPRMAWAAKYDLNAKQVNQLTTISQNFGANRRGIYDLTGNVWEWVNSCAQSPFSSMEKTTCYGGRLAMGEHTAKLNEYIRTPGKAGCGAGQPPANVGFRIVSEVVKKPYYQPKITVSKPIGGDFTLYNSQGAVSLADFRGKTVFLFFGFTTCPHICPMALGRINSSIRKLDSSLKQKVQVIFISVDPDRDSPEKLTQYTQGFNESVVGLSGSHEEIKQIAEDYGVSYKINKSKQTQESYGVSHPSDFFVVNPKGEFVGVIPEALVSKKLAEIVN